MLFVLYHAKNTKNMALQFKIQLRNITKPPVWRRVIVPDDFTFLQFHDAIQRAFGWGSCHLFEFSPSGYGSYPAIGLPDGIDIDEMADAKKVKIKSIFKQPGQKFNYIYDFGDDWYHTITLELRTLEKISSADCIDGKGKCPPENCGGPWGYKNLLKILAEPAHEEHIDMLNWLSLSDGNEWDVHEFDLEEVRKGVKNAGDDMRLPGF
jgi:hypothetical protein